MAKNPGRIKPLSEVRLEIEKIDAPPLASQEITVATNKVASHTFTLDGVSSGTYEISADVATGGQLSLTIVGSVAPATKLEIRVLVSGGGEIAIDRTPKCIGLGAVYAVTTVGILEGNAKVHVSDAVHVVQDASVVIVRSRLVFKDQASGDVRAYIHVASGSSGVVAKEDLRALVLGSKNRVQCIPELRVETKDCIATHASTLARPEEKQVQYLAAHGFTRQQGEAYIAEAFTLSV